VPIFGVGCDQGIHYYAMQFVEGRSLAAILQELRESKESPASAGEAPALWMLAQTEQVPRSAAGTLDVRPAADASVEPSAFDGEPRVEKSSDSGSTTTPCLSSKNQSLAPTMAGPMQQDRIFCRNVARLGAEAADALEHAHSLGIVHRDIKPANLLIDPQGALWITDFGLAQFPSDLSLTRTGDMVGTLRYMSPEQALGERGVVDQRTDIYALGVTLYELLTLRPAFNGRDHQEMLRQIALDEPVRPRRINSAVPRDLETIVLKAMAKESSNRYATAQELAADLRRFLDDRPILARRPGPLERTIRWARRYKELVATAAIIVIFALIVSTAAIWTEAHKTDTANLRLHAFIIKTYPHLDKFVMGAMGEATKLVAGQADPATKEEASRTYQEALGFYKDAGELPPADVESRLIIASAVSRLGFARSLLSGASAAQGHRDPQLMAQSEADYRRSLGLFEKLHAEFPNDHKISRYFAGALGTDTGSWGWLLAFTKRLKEAEPHYRRSVQLWRELIRDAGTKSNTGAPARENVATSLSDLFSLTEAIQALTSVLTEMGRGQEAEDFRRQLDEDVAAFAKQFSDQADPGRQRFWAIQFGDYGHQHLRQRRNLLAAPYLLLSTIVYPNNADMHNSLAWALASVPDQNPFPSSRAVASAQKAVELEPKNWMYWNTLGVAAFRAKDWKAAEVALEKSVDLNEGGGAIDWFFLAMTYWHQGKPEQAREFFDKAAATYVKHNPGDPELQRFHREASALLQQPYPKSEPK
jgi:tetratricopeptide (TPR) repeat protein